MSLQEVQEVLAKLYTQEILRESFLDNPALFFQNYPTPLSVEDQENLKNISPEQLRFFADSLKAKRYHEMRKCLPFSTMILMQHFQPYFYDFSKTFLPEGNQKHQQDAIRFAEFLIQKFTASSESIDRYRLEVIRYELYWIQVQKKSPCCIIQYYRYPIPTLFRQKLLPDTLPSKRSFLVIGIRFFRNTKRLHFAIPV